MLTMRNERDAETKFLEIFPKPLIKRIVGLESRQELDLTDLQWETSQTDTKIKFTINFEWAVNTKRKLDDTDFKTSPIKQKIIKTEPAKQKFIVKAEPVTPKVVNTISRLNTAKKDHLAQKNNIVLPPTTESNLPNLPKSAKPNDANNCAKTTTASTTASNSTTAVARVTPQIAAKSSNNAASVTSSKNNVKNYPRARVHTYNSCLTQYGSSGQLHISLKDTIYSLYDGTVAIYGDPLGGDDYYSNKYKLAAFFYFPSIYSTKCRVIHLADFRAFKALDQMINDSRSELQCGTKVQQYPCYRAAVVECRNYNNMVDYYSTL